MSLDQDFLMCVTLTSGCGGHGNLQRKILQMLHYWIECATVKCARSLVTPKLHKSDLSKNLSSVTTTGPQIKDVCDIDERMQLSQ